MDAVAFFILTTEVIGRGIFLLSRKIRPAETHAVPVARMDRGLYHQPDKSALVGAIQNFVAAKKKKKSYT